MLPGGLVAGSLLLSLIPGWWFLRRTESCRRPRHLSSLQEVLELVGVGVLTTGLALCAGLLIRPELVLDHSFPARTASDIRMDVVLLLGTGLAAVLLAEIAAAIVRRVSPADDSEMDIGPWWSVMRRDKIPKGKLSYAALSIAEGVTVEGVLHSYTWSPDSSHRDIALRAPIIFTRPGRKRWRTGARPVVTSTPYDYVVLPASEIKHVAVKYVDDGK